ncbi:MAG: DUF192 domain-containing protein [Candidatus Obscuribacterales bacterium]|nr:DUF192 domain-containing protein [Candidatus Obscuribacterales bacterium]
MNLSSRNTDVGLKVAILLIIGVSALFAASRGESAGRASDTPAGVTPSSVPTVKIGADVVKLEVAATPEEIERGLMYRTSLAEDQGMVFLFHPPKAVNFWMYHTLIPLDMLFVKNDKIVKIFANAQPCHSENPHDCVTYPPGKGLEASEVIELQAGYAAKHNVKEGDSVSFELPAVAAPSAKP